MENINKNVNVDFDKSKKERIKELEYINGRLIDTVVDLCQIATKSGWAEAMTGRQIVLKNALDLIEKITYNKDDKE